MVRPVEPATRGVGRTTYHAVSVQLYAVSVQQRDKFHERWCTKPIKGHQLTWNGKLGVTRFSDDEGLVTCTRCQQCWPTVGIARNPGGETLTCTGTRTTIDDWTDRTTKALEQWNKDNPNSNRLFVDHVRHRWRCERCDIHGFVVISKDALRKTSGKYVASFQKLVDTACQQHAAQEAIT